MAFLQNQLNQFQWQIWQYWGYEGIEILKRNNPPIPAAHGVYLIKSPILFDRLKGQSNILYIGQSGGGLKRGYQGIGPGNGGPGRLFNKRGLDRWMLKQLENTFSQKKFKVECHFTQPNQDPKIIERDLLKAYILDHFEPPPSNNQCFDLSLLEV